MTQVKGATRTLTILVLNFSARGARGQRSNTLSLKEIHRQAFYYIYLVIDSTNGNFKTFIKDDGKYSGRFRTLFMASTADGDGGEAVTSLGIPEITGSGYTASICLAQFV